MKGSREFKGNSLLKMFPTTLLSIWNNRINLMYDDIIEFKQ